MEANDKAMREKKELVMKFEKSIQSNIELEKKFSNCCIDLNNLKK